MYWEVVGYLDTVDCWKGLGAMVLSCVTEICCMTMGSQGAMNYKLLHSLVNQHSCGQLALFMGKLTINGHPCSIANFSRYQGVRGPKIKSKPRLISDQQVESTHEHGMALEDTSKNDDFLGGHDTGSRL